MAKFGAIDLKSINYKKSFDVKKIYNFFALEAKKQIVIIKKVGIFLIVLVVILQSYGLIKTIGTNGEKLKEKQLQKESVYSMLQKERTTLSDMIIQNEDKISKTIKIDEAKMYVTQFYEPLVLSEIISIATVNIALKKSNDNRECYNRAIATVQLNSSYSDITAFDGVVRYFTEQFLDMNRFEVIGVANGQAMLEIKKKFELN